MKNIFTRRSIRKFRNEPVNDEVITQLLRAAMYAPSAGNERPWQFLVVKNQDMLTKLSETSPYARMTKEAVFAIVVCGDLTLEKFEGYWVQDCAAATQNILLEVADNDLGAVWLGVYPMEDRVAYIRQLFALPEHIVPFAVIPVGHPAETPETPQRYDETRVHYEQW